MDNSSCRTTVRQPACFEDDRGRYGLQTGQPANSCICERRDSADQHISVRGADRVGPSAWLCQIDLSDNCQTLMSEGAPAERTRTPATRAQVWYRDSSQSNRFQHARTTGCSNSWSPGRCHPTIAINLQCLWWETHLSKWRMILQAVTAMKQL
jgi:hypothetical protein